MGFALRAEEARAQQLQKIEKQPEAESTHGSDSTTARKRGGAKPSVSGSAKVGGGNDSTPLGKTNGARGAGGPEPAGGNADPASEFQRRYYSDRVHAGGLTPRKTASSTQQRDSRGSDSAVPRGITSPRETSSTLRSPPSSVRRGPQPRPRSDTFETDTKLAAAKATTAAAQKKVDARQIRADALQQKVTQLEAKVEAKTKGAAGDLAAAKNALAEATDQLKKAKDEFQKAESAEKTAAAAAEATRNNPISQLLTQADQEIAAGRKSTSAAKKASHFVGANRALKAAADKIKADQSPSLELQRDYSARVKAVTDLFVSDPDGIRNQLLEADKKQVAKLKETDGYKAITNKADREDFLDKKFHSSLDDYLSSIEALKPYNRDLYGTDQERRAQQQKGYFQQRTAGMAEIVLNGFSQETERVRRAGSKTPDPKKPATGDGLKSKTEERRVAPEPDDWPAFADGNTGGTNDLVVKLLLKKCDDLKKAAKKHRIDGRAIAGAIYLEGRANLDWISSPPYTPLEPARLTSFAGFGTQHEVSLKVLHPEMTDEDLARAKLKIDPSLENIAAHMNAKATVREKLSGVSTRNDPVMLAADYQRSEKALIQSSVSQYRNIALGRGVNFVIGKDKKLGGQDMATGIQMIKADKFNTAWQPSARFTGKDFDRFKPTEEDKPKPPGIYVSKYKTSR